MRNFLRGTLQDDKGNYSHARLIALLVGVSATIFMWKLTILGQLTPEYFVYYLMYGVAHMNISKFLDVLNNFLGRRYESRATPGNGGGADRAEGQPGRGMHGEFAGGDVLSSSAAGREETPEEASVRRRLSAEAG